MKKKKIAIFLETEPQIGGGHQYAVLIMECLKKIQSSKYEIVAICSNQFWRTWCRKNKIRYIDGNLPSLSFAEQNFNYNFPLLAKFYNTFFTLMGKMLRDNKIDILFQTQQAYIPNYNVKEIVPVHDLMHRYERQFPEVSSEYRKREIQMKSYSRYAECILVDSELGKKQFKECYVKKKTKSPHIVSLPFVVPDYIYDNQEEYIDVPLKYIFYPAQFWKHKNHINLIKAMKILKNTIPDIHLVLVGSEKNCLKEIKNYIKNHELESNVSILGFVSNGNIKYLYTHAVAMIMPSYFGPTNIPPLEAMAVGCPVAVSDKYAMPEQVGNAGLLFNPDSPEEMAECIRKLWTDEALREKMIILGHKRVERWGKKDFEKKLLKIIDNICNVS